jgi:hypothetical protein
MSDLLLLSPDLLRSAAASERIWCFWPPVIGLMEVNSCDSTENTCMVLQASQISEDWRHTPMQPLHSLKRTLNRCQIPACSSTLAAQHVKRFTMHHTISPRQLNCCGVPIAAGPLSQAPREIQQRVPEKLLRITPKTRRET